MKIQGIPPIKAVMTPFPHWVETRQRIGRAAEMMSRHGVRHLPVVEHGKLVSVLRSEDVRRALSRSRESGEEPLVSDVCDRQVYVVRLSEPLDRVLLHMAERQIDVALVVKEGRLAGIFTVTDGCRCFGELLQSLFPRGGDDAA